MLKPGIVLFVFILLSMFSLESCSDDPVSPVTTGTIEGHIMDASTGTPIALASITLFGWKKKD